MAVVLALQNTHGDTLPASRERHVGGRELAQVDLAGAERQGQTIMMGVFIEAREPERVSGFSNLPSPTLAASRTAGTFKLPARASRALIGPS